MYFAAISHAFGPAVDPYRAPMFDPFDTVTRLCLWIMSAQGGNGVPLTSPSLEDQGLRYQVYTLGNQVQAAASL
jgi:hypothetical protein